MRKVVCFAILLSVAPCPPCLAGAAAAEQTGRYLAVFTDGKRVEGNELTGWDAYPTSPRLGETALLDPGRPLRWLRDRTLQPWNPESDNSVSYIEFVGGDRLIGHLVGLHPPDPGDGAGAPIQLRVRLGELSDQRSRPRSHTGGDVIRVSHTDVRRIVRGRQPPRTFRPKTLFLGDGRQLQFSSMRWTAAGIRLLLAGGVRLVKLSDVAELHLRGADPWEAYYRELAVLCPDGSATLLRLETTTGMILTGSTDRFGVTAEGGRRNRAIYHIIQPAWTADPIRVPFGTIRTRWHFAPHEVPLSRLAPDRVVQRAMTGYLWRWCRNRSAGGGELIAGGEVAGWGLGVHAHNELIFRLPPPARSFRTRAGLDAAAGTGGCARALVYLNAAKGKPLYRSKVLVGSADVVDSGELKLPPSGDGERSLVLVADAAHGERLAGADPLDIRDSLDWVDPLLLLDRRMLRSAVARHMAAAMPALRGWKVTAAGRMPPVRSQWNQTNPRNARFVPAMGTAGRQLTLWRSARIGPKSRWLKLRVRQVGKPTFVGSIDVRVDGRTIARMPVSHSRSDLPYVVPMEAYRGKHVDLEVIYTPGSPNEYIQWRALALVARRTNVNWVPLRTVNAVSQNGAGLKVLPDGSIFAAGGSARVSRVIDTYTVRAVTGLPQITAIRLEALADASLPGGGPGRWGLVDLTQFRLSTLPKARRELRGRYVRIERPQARATLSLAEVEVFAPPPPERTLLAKLPKPRRSEDLGSPRPADQDIVAILKTSPARRDIAQRTLLRAYLDTITENIATKGKATQSSRQDGHKAKLAIDGGVRHGYAHTEVQDQPWWQVDLGAERRIDRIVIWNRVELGHVQQLRDFDVVVLDQDGREVWRHGGIADPPAPAVTVFDSDGRDVPVEWASESPGPWAPSVARALDTTRDGWHISSLLGRSRAAVFALAQPLDARETGLQIELKHAEDRWYQTLGRFRLLATGDDPPAVPEEVPIVIHPSSAPTSKPPSGSPPTSPYALFEDDGRFEPIASADRKKIALISDDRHAGWRAVCVLPGGSYRLDLGRIVPIRYAPGEGEFRYIRFAFRKYGGGLASLGLEHSVSPDRPCRYEAGPGTSGRAGARSVWPIGLPAEWIVIDRDVYADFGRLDLTALRVSCPDGMHVVLDHIYVAQRSADFKRLAAAAPAPEQTNTKARRTLAKGVLDKGLPAVVSINADGRLGTGVLVGPDGWVLTAGHLIAPAGSKIKIRLRDGREVRARAAGIDRDTDVGLVKITDKGTFGGLKLSGDRSFQYNRMYVGFSFTPAHEDGKTPLSYVTLVKFIGWPTADMVHTVPYALVGGPLLDSQGSIVGVHIDSPGNRFLRFTKAGSAAEHWDRLTRGEILGKWMPDTGPMMGIHTAERKGSCQITRIYDRSPAVAAGLRRRDIVLTVAGQPVANHYQIGGVLATRNPGDTVVLRIKRGEKTFDCKVGLMRREKLPRPPPWKPKK